MKSQSIPETVIRRFFVSQCDGRIDLFRYIFEVRPDRCPVDGCASMSEKKKMTRRHTPTKQAKQYKQKQKLNGMGPISVFSSKLVGENT